MSAARPPEGVRTAVHSTEVFRICAARPPEGVRTAVHSTEVFQ
jgi:hypothetical protein